MEYICQACGLGIFQLDGRAWYHTESPATSHLLIPGELRYVVTFNPRPVTGPGSIDGLRRMTLPDARALRTEASRIPKSGRIVDAETLEVIA